MIQTTIRYQKEERIKLNKLKKILNIKTDNKVILELINDYERLLDEKNKLYTYTALLERKYQDVVYEMKNYFIVQDKIKTMLKKL